MKSDSEDAKHCGHSVNKSQLVTVTFFKMKVAIIIVVIFQLKAHLLLINVVSII